jgi:hypothetical protein
VISVGDSVNIVSFNNTFGESYGEVEDVDTTISYKCEKIMENKTFPDGSHPIKLENNGYLWHKDDLEKL